MLPAESAFVPSSGLKNCPTAIEAAGGGLPEIVWILKFRTSTGFKIFSKWSNIYIFASTEKIYYIYTLDRKISGGTQHYN